jgi:hypothetical protein
MGIDAKAVLKTAKGPLDIMWWLNSLEHVRDVSVKPSYQNGDGFVYIDLKWHGEQRHIACFHDGKCKCDYESIWPHDACFISISAFGFSDAIIMSLVKKFGGFYQINDCTDDWSEYLP